jgi:uncharacterized damage-inducible protein DinB
MPTLTISRPAADEHVAYYSTYIDRVPDGDIIERLSTQIRDTIRLLSPIDEAKALHRYAPGKWSVKEVIGHMTDGERVFAYRALRIARADATPLAGFDENAWVPAGKFDARPLTGLLEEFAAVRVATVALFRSLDEETARRRGTANGNVITPRALAYIIAGHEFHHVGILKERYGISG